MIGEDLRFRGHDQPSGRTSSLRKTRYSVTWVSYISLSSASNKISEIRRFFLVRSDDVRRYLRCPYAHATNHRYRDWDGTQPWRPGERHRPGDSVGRMSCAVGGILVDAGWFGLYAGGMRRWVRTAVIDVYMGGSLAMILDCAEQAVRHDTVSRKAGARWKENYKSCSKSEKCRWTPQSPPASSIP